MKISKSISKAGFILSVFLIPAFISSHALADKNAPLAALGAVPVPADNKQSAAKVELGKLLFFDPRIGGDASVSCADCHSPKQGWGFNDPLSRGYPGVIHWRNSQTVINSAYLGKLFWAGSAKSLEAQAPSAALGAISGNGERDMIEARLAFIPDYVKRFRNVFGDRWPRVNNVWKAIAAFERTLIHDNTPFDKYMRGDKKALSAEQVRGLKLFQGKANCIECHNGPLLTDQKYYNLGVPTAEEWQTNGMAQITFRYEQYAKGVTEEMYRTVNEDAGLYYRTKQKRDKGKFRTPPLRYTAYTAPFMHNGSFFDFDEIVEFYNEGGGKNDFSANKTKLLKPLKLSDQEKEDLVAFLESLSGPEIKMVTPKLSPYAPLD
ncbi:MAG: cytochrome c peroxidase [Rhodospirillales bacterium]|jgi:cytochrome c peroxidase|nr:cytochrome-c peroxidase [Rhodospirillaceae bacterium]MDP6643136.1 cytochrome c peroxidase [Rhodospirillales bacterium]MDP6840075.1 cytochrome c peroxidase [Rhodospirillales bacterium]|tara:strand:- start:236 stop:1366 length:1131 start_codon:yes stop_codon:yes gene_type:complete